MEKNGEVHQAGCYTPRCTSGHQVHGSFWTPGTCLLPQAWLSHQGGNRGTLIPPLPTPENCSDDPAGEHSRGAGTSPPEDTDPIFNR